MRQQGLSRTEKQTKDRRLATLIQREKANAWCRARRKIKKQLETSLSSTIPLPSLHLERNEDNPAVRRLKRRVILAEKSTIAAVV
jgi:hypothetical protein